MTSNELWKRMCGGLKFRIKWPDGINTYDYAPDLDYVVNFFDYQKRYENIQSRRKRTSLYRQLNFARTARAAVLWKVQLKGP